jgi:predicted transposase/invertase (TIGR01784 family)
MAERIAFSTGRNLARQIAPGQTYSKIEKVVTIVIANYNIIAADGNYHHIFRLYDSENRVLFTDIMEVHTLELKKLSGAAVGMDDKENELLNWLRLIRSEEKEEIEMLATKTPAMKKAVSRLKVLSADERTRMLYEARELYVMDEMARLEGARDEGLKEGLKEGRDEAKIETARNLLKMKLSVEQISQATGLTVEEIQSLKD